jgi:transposase
LLARLKEVPIYSRQRAGTTADGRCGGDSLPCVGRILSAVLALEIGEVRRFSGPDRLVSYAGLVPVALESADWKRKDRCPRDCNVYLKWAYVEAANLISIQRHRWKGRHVVQLYEATVAVARHLAEASYWMLIKQEVYQEPRAKWPVLSPTHG